AKRANTVAHMENTCRRYVAVARLREARGDIGGALELLAEAERHERRDPVPRPRPIPALRARLHLAQGQLANATAWAQNADVSVDDELSYLREYEHLTLARLLIARRGSIESNVVPFLESL